MNRPAPRASFACRPGGRHRPFGIPVVTAAWMTVRPARDHLRVSPAPRVAVAEQPPRAGPRVRPQPVADVDGQPDPAVRPGRQRHRGERAAQPRELDLPAADRVIDCAVTAAALRLQRQLASMFTRCGLHSTASASSNSASARPVRHRYSSPRNPVSTLRACPTPRPSWKPSSSQGILNATATACHHGDTRDKPRHTRWPGQDRLNNKLRQPRPRRVDRAVGPKFRSAAAGGARLAESGEASGDTPRPF